MRFEVLLQQQMTAYLYLIFNFQEAGSQKWTSDRRETETEVSMAQHRWYCLGLSWSGIWRMV